MCSVGLIAPALSVVGTAFSVLGGARQASAERANAEYQKQVSLDNAALTTLEKRDARERGADREQQIYEDGARIVADTRGALAANNMDLTFGSPLDTILNTTVAIQEDAARARRNTDKEVYDLEVQRRNFLNNANVQGATAKNARTGGFISGVGTALKGAANVYRSRVSLE